MTVLICSEYILTRLRDLERTALRGALQRRGVYFDYVTEQHTKDLTPASVAEFAGVGDMASKIVAEATEDVTHYIDAMPVEVAFAATVSVLRDDNIETYVHYQGPDQVVIPALERTGLGNFLQAAVPWADLEPAVLVGLVAEHPDDVLVLGHDMEYLAPYIAVGCHTVCCSHEDINPRSVLDLLHTIDTLQDPEHTPTDQE